MKKFWKTITNKWLIKGTTTVILVALVIAAYILINWGVDKIKVSDLDFTEKKLYSLSEATKSRIKDLDEEITVQLLNMSEYSYITEYVDKYTRINSKIKTERIDDLSARTDLQTKYNILPTDSLIVIKIGDKEKTIAMDDLYTYDYTTGEQIDKTEEVLTNSMVEMTIDEKPKIYILTGKTFYPTEQAMATTIGKLKEESNEVEFLDILTTGNVPDDCDCLIITTLKQDLTDLERDKILDYINNGGKIMMLTSQNIINLDMPNLDQILAQYGITIDYGVAFEQDSSKMLVDSPEMIIADVNASFLRKLDMTLNACLIDAGKIQFANDEKLSELGVTYETILTTSDKAFVRTDLENIESSKRTDADGAEETIIMGALVDKKISDDKTSQLIVYSNEIFATGMSFMINPPYYTYAVALYNNEDIILNSISHLTERDDTIVIRKTSESETYEVTDQEDVIIKTIIFVVPMFVIGAGIVVWYLRQRKI